MKELEKTRNLSLLTVLAILVIVIGLLTFKRPAHLYAVSAETALMEMTSSSFLIPTDSIDTNSFLIDVRSFSEYDRGHLEDAAHMALPDLLSTENVARIKAEVANGKTIVFYGADLNEALTAKMLLDQLGYTDASLLAVNLSYNQDELVVRDVDIEATPEDIQAYIDSSVKEAEAKKTMEIKPIPKQVIPQKKKKKMPVEGGC